MYADPHFLSTKRFENGLLFDRDDFVANLALRLNEVQNPNANKAFNMVDNHLQFLWVAPVTGGGISGALEIEASGNFDGDLVHIHQHTGNPGAGTDLVHIEAADADVLPLRIIGNGNAADITGNTKITGNFEVTGTVTFANNQISFAELQDISATSRLLGRITAGAGDTEELTGTQATTLLDLFSTTTTTKGLVPGSNNLGINYFLRADGTWAVPPGGSGGVTDGDKGDITVSGGGVNWQIDPLAITDADINDVAWSKITGEPTTLAGYGISDTKANFNIACSDGNFLFVGDITQYTDEQAQDAIGALFIDSAHLDFTYDDVGNTLTALIKTTADVQLNSLGIGIAPSATSKLIVSSTGSVTESVKVVQAIQTTTGSACVNAYVTYDNAGTIPSAVAFNVAQLTKLQGTISNAVGFYCADINSGVGNFGFSSALTAGVGKWNFIAAADADNYFAGNVFIGNSSTQDATKLKVIANVPASFSLGFVRYEITYNATTYGAAASSAFYNKVSMTGGSVDGAGSTTVAIYNNMIQNSTSSLGVLRGIDNLLDLINSGSVSVVQMYHSRVNSASSGIVSTCIHYNCGLPSFSSTGSITNFIGFRVTNQGHATLVGEFTGVLIQEQTKGTGATYGFRSQLTDVAGKWNIYVDGTAPNYIAGKLLIGSSTDNSLGELQVTSNIWVNQQVSCNGGSIFGSSYRGFNVTGTDTNQPIVALRNTTSTPVTAYILALSTGMVVATLTNNNITFTTNGAPRGLISNAGSFVLSNAAVATNATDGFIYSTSCAGPPTGTPTSYAGRIPFIFDSTFNTLFYYSEFWRPVDSRYKATRDWEEFVPCPGPTANGICKLNWTMQSAGTNTNAFIAGETNHPGILRLTCGSVNGNNCGPYLQGGTSTLQFIQSTDLDEFIWVVRSGGTVTNYALRVGFGSDPSNANLGANAVFFELIAGQTAIQYTCVAAGAVTRQASGITIAASTWYVFRAKRDSSNRWTFTINGANSFQHLAGASPSAAISPMAIVGQNTGSARSLDLDFFEYRSKYISR